MNKPFCLVVSPRHVHVAETIGDALHIAWSGRVPCPPDSGAFGVGPDPQSINGDESWIVKAADAIQTAQSTDDSEIRLLLLSAGVPFV